MFLSAKPEKTNCQFSFRVNSWAEKGVSLRWNIGRVRPGVSFASQMGV